MAPSKETARNIALGTTIASFVMSLILAAGYYGQDYAGVQFELVIPWIDSINVYFRTGIDGISLPLVILTTALSVLVVLAAWPIEKAAKAFMALYMLLLTGMLGVFMSLDMFLFYVFFEVSLLPMYFLIGIWGGPRKEYAAIKFFLYTLAGSICLLVVMMGLFFLTPAATGGQGNTWAMVTSAASDTVSLQSDAVRALFAADGPHWGFAKCAFVLTFIAFAIKLPMAPFHTWLPDAHVQAPTPISMILAGVLLKMGGYALLRITYPFFPDAAVEFWVLVASLGVFSIIYGALCAMAQTDWKKLVAYSSVSHMGYVCLGIAVMTKVGIDGAYYQMIGHGIGSAMMFFLVGVLYERAHHRDLNRFGGMWLRWPKYGAFSLIGFFAGMGLPGLCGFIGEIMVLLGTFDAASAAHGQANLTAVYTLGIIAASGVVLTAGYILWMFQRVYMGQDKPEYDSYEPVNSRENFVMMVLTVGAIVFGLVPWLVFSITESTIGALFTDIFKLAAVAAN